MMLQRSHLRGGWDGAWHAATASQWTEARAGSPGRIRVPSRRQAFVPCFAARPDLLKGGGAIRGIGEKFAANPATGTGSMTVSLSVSPGRSGFGPQLTLSYDSGSGNGPFGLGWTLSLRAITRKAGKGLPRYDDHGTRPDVFMLSGAEDLAPVWVKHAGAWVQASPPSRTIHGKQYHITLYRPLQASD